MMCAEKNPYISLSHLVLRPALPVLNPRQVVALGWFIFFSVEEDSMASHAR
jgi:hypothetical protein